MASIGVLLLVILMLHTVILLKKSERLAASVLLQLLHAFKTAFFSLDIGQA
jgi:hypothetical protein